MGDVGGAAGRRVAGRRSAHATVVVPALLAGALLAGASLCALAMRERPLMRHAFGGAALLAVLPWLDPWLLVPAAPSRSCSPAGRRGAGATLIALGTAEIQLASLVFYVSLNERLYGGVSPLAALDGPATGASSAGEYLERVPRLALLFVDPGYGLAALGAGRGCSRSSARLLLARSRRERLARLVSDQRDAEHAAFLALAVCAAQVLVAAFTVPSLGGRVVPGAPARAGAAVRGRADRLGLAAAAAGGRGAGGPDRGHERVGAARRRRLDVAARRQLTIAIPSSRYGASSSSGVPGSTARWVSALAGALAKAETVPSLSRVVRPTTRSARSTITRRTSASSR